MRTHDWHRDLVVINWYSDDGEKRKDGNFRKEGKERREKKKRERERERGRGDKYCFPCAI